MTLTLTTRPSVVAQDVVDELAEAIGRPVVLDDDALGLVAHSVQDGIVDAARTRTILLRSTDPETSAAVFAFGIATARTPVRLPALPRLGMEERLCVPVRLGGRAVGYLWVIDPARRLSQEQIGRVADAAERLRGVLSPGSEETFGDVLARTRRLRAELSGERRDDRLRPVGTSATLLVVTALRGAEAHRAEADRVMALQSRLDAVPGDLAWTVCPSDGDAVVLAVARGPVADAAAAADRLWDALAPVRTARTRIATAPAEGGLAEAARQARAALWVADLPGAHTGPARPGPVVHWADLGFWRVLAAPLMSPGAAERMAAELPAGVRTLVEAGGADDLLPTLRSYLAHGGDVRTCAAELHVHRSTLYYRLQRLTDLLAVDLRDGSVRFELMLGLCVLDARAARTDAQTAVPGLERTAS